MNGLIWWEVLKLLNNIGECVTGIENRMGLSLPSHPRTCESAEKIWLAGMHLAAKDNLPMSDNNSRFVHSFWYSALAAPAESPVAYTVGWPLANVWAYVHHIWYQGTWWLWWGLPISLLPRGCPPGCKLPEMYWKPWGSCTQYRHTSSHQYTGQWMQNVWLSQQCMPGSPAANKYW